MIKQIIQAIANKQEKKERSIDELIAQVRRGQELQAERAATAKAKNENYCDNAAHYSDGYLGYCNHLEGEA